MQACVTLNPQTGIPVLTVTAETESEELSLALVAECESFKVVIECPREDSLAIREIC